MTLGRHRLSVVHLGAVLRSNLVLQYLPQARNETRFCDLLCAHRGVRLSDILGRKVMAAATVIRETFLITFDR